MRERRPPGSPRPVTTLEPAPTRQAAPTPDPPSSPAPPAIASPLPTTDPAPDAKPGWLWMLGAAIVLLAGIGLVLARRQRTPEDEGIAVPDDADEPEAIVPIPAVAAPRLSLWFRPTRIGFNMLSATAEGELTIGNDGEAAAEDVRVRVALLGAHAGQAADMDAFLAEPIGRPAVPPFALAPGERRTLRVVAAAPRAGLRTMVAAGRPIYVPVLAANLRLAGEKQVAQAFAIGVERVDSAKLAPFWLDVADRAYSAVAARPQGPAVERPAPDAS